jgi:hypothetical protein
MSSLWASGRPINGSQTILAALPPADLALFERDRLKPRISHGFVGAFFGQVRQICRTFKVIPMRANKEAAN